MLIDRFCIYAWKKKGAIYQNNIALVPNKQSPLNSGFRTANYSPYAINYFNNITCIIWLVAIIIVCPCIITSARTTIAIISTSACTAVAAYNGIHFFLSKSFCRKSIQFETFDFHKI